MREKSYSVLIQIRKSQKCLNIDYIQKNDNLILNRHSSISFSNPFKPRIILPVIHYRETTTTTTETCIKTTKYVRTDDKFHHKNNYNPHAPYTYICTPYTNIAVYAAKVSDILSRRLYAHSLEAGLVRFIPVGVCI